MQIQLNNRKNILIFVPGNFRSVRFRQSFIQWFKYGTKNPVSFCLSSLPSMESLGCLNQQERTTGCLLKFEFQINNEFFFQYKYVSCNIWDLFILKIICCLSEIQIPQGVLYFIRQPYPKPCLSVSHPPPQLCLVAPINKRGPFFSRALSKHLLVSSWPEMPVSEPVSFLWLGNKIN